MMSDAEFRELERVALISSLVAMVFHTLIFCSAIALLARARDRVARMPHMRPAAWTLFVIVALTAYVISAVPSWLLDEHLIFWRTGTYSICHLTGIIQRFSPLFVGFIFAAIIRPAGRRLALLGGSAMAILGSGYLALAAFLWATFKLPAMASNSLFVGPVRGTLFSVMLAAALVLVTGGFIVQQARMPAPAN
jgi:hypothetical protein